MCEWPTFEDPSESCPRFPLHGCLNGFSGFIKGFCHYGFGPEKSVLIGTLQQSVDVKGAMLGWRLL